MNLSTQTKRSTLFSVSLWTVVLTIGLAHSTAQAQSPRNVLTSPAARVPAQSQFGGASPINGFPNQNFAGQQAIQGRTIPQQNFQGPGQGNPNLNTQSLPNPMLGNQIPEQISPTLLQNAPAQQNAPFQQATPVQQNPAPQVPMQIRIKDITTIEGHRSNRLQGVGIVTGLKGTGGQEELTQQLAANMLQNFNIRAENIPSGSMSVVAVTAEIPPFSRPGEKITATVSTIDNASGLFGGELQTTLLKGMDGQVYAIAGGTVVLSGFSAEGQAGTITKNHDTSGKVEAQVEVPIEEEPAFPGVAYRLLLTNKDYATAHRIASEVNKYFPGHASALDQGTVHIYFPKQYMDAKFEFVVKINELRIVPDAPARVVINQRTGTIVVGQNVRLSRIMFANENLIITTNEAPVAAQPAPFSQGQTAILPRTELTASETGGGYNLLNQNTTVGELAGVLNRLGVSPRDMIGIFESIKRSGALQAQLIIE